MSDSYWLYELIHKEKLDWKPVFALPSSLNWMRALSLEIQEEHGSSVGQQLEACRVLFKKSVRVRPGSARLDHVFGSLYYSLIYSMSLISLCGDGSTCRPWTWPTCVIAWYYAIYNAVHSLIASTSGAPPQTHTRTIKQLTGSGIRAKLPHPLNMVASHVRLEKYSCALPNYPGSQSSKVTCNFDFTRPTAQGMLIAYLSGTAQWQVEAVKDRIRSKGTFSDFRTPSAQQERDKSLPRQLNFLHCAYRYRGKANYRDSMFLTYGRDNSLITSEFTEALCNVAKFCFICAFAYAERRLGQSHVRDFLNDVRTNLRFRAHAGKGEAFWEQISL